MSLAARRALGVGLALMTGLVYAGCAATSTDTSAPARPNTSDAGSDADEAGSAGTANGVGGKAGLGDLNTNAEAGAGGSANDSCAANVSTAQVVPLDMFVMMDTSLSMNDVTDNGIVKWTAVKGALESFLKDDGSAGLGVGIQYFPQNKPDIPATCTSDADCGAASPCLLKLCAGYDEAFPCVTDASCDSGVLGPTPDCEQVGQCGAGSELCLGVGLECETNDDPPKDAGACTALSDPKTLAGLGLGTCVNTAKCDAASYSTPAQAIAQLPDAAPALVASIEAQTPFGNTPTAPALTGAINQASVWAKAHPDHQVIAVMVTDGLPTQCGPTAIADISKIASDGLAAAPSIKTFVVGIFGADDIQSGAGNSLSKIAQAGGTNSAFILYTSDDVSSQLSAALDAIRGTRLACEYQVPEPAPGQTLDYTRVNMSVKRAKVSTTLYYVGSLAECDPLTGGWYYNTDPETTDPTRIEVCPTTCTAFQAATNASVEIAVGCQTVVK